MYHRGEGVLADLPVPFDATRYHSLIVDRDTLPQVLKVTAETSDGLIMGLRHREVDVEGVQFHPESVLTGVGMRLLGTYLARCVAARDARDGATAIA
jgi:anthranilate/para-aminobenzoate synthase component II